MLKLTHISGHNACQFDDVSYDVSPGLTAVTGPNGRGKSSLLRILMYALTGIVDGEYGNQSTLQKDGTADPGWAEVEFTDGAHDYRLRRFSTSDIKFYDTLHMDGELLAMRRKAVDARLTELYGVAPSLLFQLSWCRQGRLDYMLTAPAAIVNQFLQGVFDMKGLEKIREKIKTASDTIASYPASLSEAAARHRSELESLPAEGSFDAPLSGAEADRQRLETEKAELDAAASVGISQDAYDRQVSAFRTAISRYDLWLESHQETDEPAKPQLSVAEIDEELAALERSYHTRENDIGRATHDRDLAADRMASVKSSLLELEQSAAETAEKLSHPDIKCPLCGGSIADRKEYDKARHRMLCGHASLEEYNKAIEEKRAGLQRKLEDFGRNVDAAVARIKANESSMQVSLSRAEILQGQRDAAVAWDSWRALHERRAEMAEARDRELSNLEAFMRTPTYSTDIKDRLETVEGELKEARARAASLRSEKSSTDALRKQLTEAVALEEAMSRQMAVNADARDTLSELREVFSQQRTQAIFLRSRIQVLNARIAHFMQGIQMPFTLELDPDTHVFVQTTQEGYRHPASHLSGAQKSMAACVLQMSLMSVVQPSMNLFLLDEPGESLDDQNKIVMADLFSRMSRMLPSIEGVMLIVTRDRHLIEACANNLEVGAHDSGDAG